MPTRYVGYYVKATRHAEVAEASLVRQELTITRLRMRGVNTTSAEDILAQMRRHLVAMREDRHRFEERLRHFGLYPAR